jgi:hypothetical protein
MIFFIDGEIKLSLFSHITTPIWPERFALHRHIYIRDSFSIWSNIFKLNSALGSEISVQRPDDPWPFKKIRLFERQTRHTNNVFLARERERAQGKANHLPQCNRSPNEVTSEHLKSPRNPNQPDPQCPITRLTTFPRYPPDIHRRANIFGKNCSASQSKRSKIHVVSQYNEICCRSRPPSRQKLSTILLETRENSAIRSRLRKKILK